MKAKLIAAALFGILVSSSTYAADVAAPAKAADRQPELWQRRQPPRFTLEERKKRRQEIKRRLTRQVSELEKKKIEGTLGDEDRRRLERLQKLAARFDRVGGNGNLAPAVLGSPAGNPTNGKASAKPK